MKINGIKVQSGIQDIIISVCCVDGKFLGLKDGFGNSGVSHGYCQRCLDNLMRRVEG